MERNEEEMLWLRFKEGEEEALSDIYEKYVHALFSFGCRIYGDEFLVRDCIQEVFIQLINKRHKIIISRHSYLYLFKALRNKLLEELRSKNKRSKLLSLNYSDPDCFCDSIEQSIVRSEEDKKRRKILTRALNCLSDYQREAVFLRYSQGFEYEEIAEVLGIDTASARTLLYRSLKKLREVINHENPVLILFGLLHPLSNNMIIK